MAHASGFARHNAVGIRAKSRIALLHLQNSAGQPHRFSAGVFKLLFMPHSPP
jgi:hypothetical protein